MGDKKVYNFRERLDFSLEMQDLITFDKFYAHAFPEITSIERVDDLQTQKRGIDLYLHLANGDIISIDEKKDSKYRDTIFLELYSDLDANKKSWLFTAECDYIVYFLKSNGVGYVLPMRSLRRAYSVNETEWLEKYTMHTIENTQWRAIGVGVPIDEILKKVKGARMLPLTR